MNKFAFVISGFLFIALFGGFSVQTAEANTLSQILKTMDQHKKSLTDLESNIRMTEVESAIGDSTTRNGTVKYVPRPGRDARIRIDWNVPNETLLIDNGQYVIFRRKTNEAILGKVNGSKQKKTGSTFEVLGMSKKELQSKYKIQYLGTVKVAGEDHWHLRMIPKNLKKESFKVSELYVDKDGMPMQAMIQHKNDDLTKVRLSKAKKNKMRDYNVFVKELFAEMKRKKAKKISA